MIRTLFYTFVALYGLGLVIGTVRGFRQWARDGRSPLASYHAERARAPEWRVQWGIRTYE
jgi:hypothetical protein